MHVRLLALLLGLAVATAPAARADAPAGAGRIRTIDTRTARLMQVALDHSPILRALVASIDAMPVIVYVGSDRDLPTGLDGRTGLVAAGRHERFIRIAIRHGLSDSRTINTLAHELEHAREIAIRPNVRDSASLAQMYRQIGHTHDAHETRAWETEGARWVGAEVQREVARNRSEQRSR